MYSKIDKGFQVAFDIAWGAFVSGSIPVGACILNENDEVVSVGQNQIFTEGDGLISHHQLAHAEANAILKISEYPRSNEHQNVRKYTLYTTMEPCPFCFGAIAMGSIRHVKFAARLIPPCTKHPPESFFCTHDEQMAELCECEYKVIALVASQLRYSIIAFTS